MLVRNKDGVWTIQSKTTIVRLPVREVVGRGESLPDISVTFVGAGQLEPITVVLPYDGGGYAPNPSVAPAYVAADRPGRVPSLGSNETSQDSPP